MNLTAKLKKLRDALTGLQVSVYHYRRAKMSPPFVVWQEDGESDSFYADNSKREQPVSGTLDYFTRTEYDETVDEIQQRLEKACASWQLLSVQYEEETGLIHYEWEWTVV